MLSKSDCCYIDQNRATLSPEELAKDLSKPLRTVKTYLKNVAAPEPAAPPLEPVKTGMDKYVQYGNGCVAATEAAAIEGDESTRRSGGYNEEFMKTRAKNAIHKINPDKPTR